jgi:hypothetical protein
MFCDSSRPGFGSGRLKRFLFTAIFLAGAVVPAAKGDFVSPFALSNFTLTNSANANGSATTPDAGHTVILTGPNDGSGLVGSTELTIVSPATGLFRFDWVYNSLDSPGADSGGYVLNGQFVVLATADGQSGSVSVQVRTGDRIGFRVDTVDNIAEPGVLTITNFAPPAVAVPTLSTVGLLVLVLLLLMSGPMLLNRRIVTSRE